MTPDPEFPRVYPCGAVMDAVLVDEVWHITVHGCSIDCGVVRSALIASDHLAIGPGSVTVVDVPQEES